MCKQSRYQARIPLRIPKRIFSPSKGSHLLLGFFRSRVNARPRACSRLHAREHTHALNHVGSNTANDAPRLSDKKCTHTFSLSPCSLYFFLSLSFFTDGARCKFSSTQLANTEIKLPERNARDSERKHS